MKINSQDISVVVQGKIDPEKTPLVLASIRKALPKATIILSTWKGENTKGLDCDICIKNKDVGPNVCLDGSSFNLSRQIYSTIQGLNRVKTKYAIKIRSTCMLNDDRFLRYFRRFNAYVDSYKIFKERIIIPSHYTVFGKGDDKYSDEKMPYLYTVSDWFFFGLTEDLIKLFDIPLAPEQHTYSLYHPMVNHGLLMQRKNKPGAQYLDQQYIFIQALLKAGKNIAFRDWTDISFDSRFLSRLYILNNFVILDYKNELNIEDLKYKNTNEVEDAKVFRKWLKLYRKYCVKNIDTEKFKHYINLIWVKTTSKWLCSSNALKNYFIDKKIELLTRIKTKDISVVVQGAVDRKYTIKCLKSIRKKLPRAEIVLSTWEGTDVSGLDYDVLVLNKDPGAYVFTPNGKKQNQNRQVLSTQNGIKKTSRKYVLKIRSDMKIMGTRFLSYFDKFKERNKECKIFQKRILINSLYTRSPDSKKPFLFHPSDWMMFGLREDVLNLWDIPLAPEPETSQYFVKHPQLPHERGCLTRWHAEQYVWLAFLKKNGIKFDFDNYMVFNDKLARLSKLSIVNNCTLLEYREQFDILCQKYPYKYGDSPTMHHLQWLFDYKDFCSPKYHISLLYALKVTWEQNPDRLLVYKHLYKLFKPFLLVLRCRWIEDLFAIPFYIFKTLISYIKRTKKCLNAKK